MPVRHARIAVAPGLRGGGHTDRVCDLAGRIRGAAGRLVRWTRDDPGSVAGRPSHGPAAPAIRAARGDPLWNRPGWSASAPADRAAATSASGSRRSTNGAPSFPGTIARTPRRPQVCRIRRAISPRLATNTVRIASAGGVPVWRAEMEPAGVVVGPPASTNASRASDATRNRPPTRRAGSRPAAIQR